jgi:hypothetical protein
MQGVPKSWSLNLAAVDGNCNGSGNDEIEMSSAQYSG